MRAAMLLIPFAALAAVAISAGAPPLDPYENVALNDEAMVEMNYGEDGMNGMEMELSNDSMEADAMDMDSNMAMEMNMTDTDMTAEAAPRPAWMAGGMWLWAGEEESGAVWYFEPLDSDFSRSPYRVRLRTDETADRTPTADNTERLAEIDCTAQRYRILRTTRYDDAGRATEANERGDGSLVPVPPGSVFAQVTDSVCTHAEYQRANPQATFNAM